MGSYNRQDRRYDGDEPTKAGRRSQRRHRFPWDDPADNASAAEGADDSPAVTAQAEPELDSTDRDQRSREQSGIDPPLPDVPGESPWSPAGNDSPGHGGAEGEAPAREVSNIGTEAGSRSTRDLTARWCTLGDGRQVELASAGTRLAGRIIDWTILAIVAGTIVGILVAATWDSDDGSNARWPAVALTNIVIGLLYEITLIATRGQTVGKLAAGAKVVRLADGGVPGWRTSLRRWAIPGLAGALAAAMGITFEQTGIGELAAIPVQVVAGLVVLFCYLALTWDGRRQGWHDKAASTVVVATGRTRRSTGLAVAGLILGLVPLIPETWLTVAISDDPDRWLEGWDSLGTVLLIIVLTPINLAFWIGSGVFSGVALGRARRGPIAARVVAVCGLLAIGAGIGLLVVLFRTVLSA